MIPFVKSSMNVIYHKSLAEKSTALDQSLPVLVFIWVLVTSLVSKSKHKKNVVFIMV